MEHPRSKSYLLTSVLAAVTAFSLAVAASAAEVKVYSNNPAPGDYFTNSVGTSNPLTPGAAIGSSGWYYNNVRNTAAVGIRTDYPRSGNGSVFFSSTTGVGKADVEYFYSAPQLLSSLDAFSYDWYRNSSSSVASHLHPTLRLIVTNGTQSGYLVFERAYNPSVTPVPTDTWVTDDVINAKFWGTGSLPGAFSVYDRNLSDWSALLGPNAVVVGISSGIGSGWNGTFEGAVDNITVGFNGVSTTYNFEVIPEPAFFQMGILASLGGLGFLRMACRK